MDMLTQMLQVLPQELREKVIASAVGHTVIEVVLYANCPVQLRTMNGAYLLPDTITSAAVLQQVLEACCRYSLHAMQDLLCQGFVTLENGCRVGVCGEAVCRSGTVTSVIHPQSLHLRLGRSRPGCADELDRRLFARGLCSALLVGAPATGKTTLLKDLVIHLVRRGVRMSVMDERLELSELSGLPLDLLRGYPKAIGMELALRCLAPQLLVLDEIGSLAEAQAVRNAAMCGVYTLATAHSGSLTEWMRRQDMRPLMEDGAFAAICLLKKDQPGQIAGIYRPDWQGVWQQEMERSELHGLDQSDGSASGGNGMLGAGHRPV